MMRRVAPVSLRGVGALFGCVFECRVLLTGQFRCDAGQLEQGNPPCIPFIPAVTSDHVGQWRSETRPIMPDHYDPQRVTARRVTGGHGGCRSRRVRQDSAGMGSRRTEAVRDMSRRS